MYHSYVCSLILLFLIRLFSSHVDIYIYIYTLKMENVHFSKAKVVVVFNISLGSPCGAKHQQIDHYHPLLDILSIYEARMKNLVAQLDPDC